MPLPLQEKPERLFWWADLTPGGPPSGEGELPAVRKSRVITGEADANLIGSLTTVGTHMPVLDIDRIPVKLIESTTPGNFHLYIDKELSWPQYRKLLKLLGELGILEEGYVSASLDRQATFVRKPGVKK